MYSDIILQTYDTYSLQSLKSDLVHGQLDTKTASGSEGRSRRRIFHLTTLGQKLSARSVSPRRAHQQQGQSAGHR